MQLANPFAASGKWYKGNLHTHTARSDGELEPEEIEQSYRAAGYDFLALTDHDRVTEPGEVSDEEFLLLLGAEMAGDQGEVAEQVHVVAFGLASAGDVPEGPTVPDAIAWAVDHGGEAIIAHPYWSGLVVSDLLQWEGHLGIEVFNTTCHVTKAKGHSAVHWDDLLGRGRCPWGFAVDDAHRSTSHRPTDLCRAWVMARAPELTREAVLEALRAGHFYSSCGPAIHEIAMCGGEVRARTSPVKEINFVAQRWAGGSVAAPEGTALTEATYRLQGHEAYLRVECRDTEGRWAWSNPIFLGD